MVLREVLAKQPIAVICIAAIALAVSGWFILSSGRRHELVEQAYYYDLESRKLIVDHTGKVPPFTTSTGQTAVRAAVFSCSSCDDASSRFVGYLEKYSDAYVKAMGDPVAFTPEIAEKGHLIRTETGDSWVGFASPEGRQITIEVARRCGEKPPVSCFP